MPLYKSPAIHRTPLYRAKSAYVSMGHRCLNRVGKNPSYADVELRMTLEEWIAWAVPEYERFDREHPGESPNVSRIGDKGNYEIGNVRITTKTANLEEYAAHSVGRIKDNGTKLCSGCKNDKPLAMFHKNRLTATGYSYYCKDCTKEFMCAYAPRRNEIRNNPKAGPKPIEHGTSSGYSLERQRGIPHCEPCIEANREYVRDYKKRLKEKFLGGTNLEA